MNDYPLFASARRSDPASSHAAAAKMNRSGRTKTQGERVVTALRAYGPCTSRELAEASEIAIEIIRRRLPDLEFAGLARKNGERRCRRAGGPAIEWEAV